MTDVVCSDHAAFWTFRPASMKGEDWCRVHLSDLLVWRGSWVVRDGAEDLITRMADDGVRAEIRQSDFLRR